MGGDGAARARAKRHWSGHPPAVFDRASFEPRRDLARTGLAWWGLPDEFGQWDAVFNPFRRRAASGGPRRLFEAMTDARQAGEFQRVLIVATIVRAH